MVTPFAQGKVAVSGGNGFIGRALMAELAARDFECCALHGDVRRAEGFDGEFSILIHLAAATHPQFRDNPKQAWEVNVEGTRNAIEACIKNNARLIFASTSGVYDPKQPMPVGEGGKVAPTTAYGESKREGELLCEMAATGGDCRTTILRLFNPYGPGQPSYMLISYLIEELKAGRMPCILSPGSERDFVYVDDVAKAFVSAIADQSDFSIYNVGSGHPCSVLSVFETLTDLIGTTIEAEVAIDIETKNSVIADIRAIEAALKWRPMISLQEGLHRLLIHEWALS